MSEVSAGNYILVFKRSNVKDQGIILSKHYYSNN